MKNKNLPTRMKYISLWLEETQEYIRQDKFFKVWDSIYELSLIQIKCYIEVLENLLKYPKLSVGSTDYVRMKIIPALKYVIRKKKRFATLN